MAETAGSMVLEKEIVIPAGKGGAFTVDKGKVFRVIALEGEQCLDAAFFNAKDYRETYHNFFTFSYNSKLGTGNTRCIRTFFSRPPWERPMMTVLEDTVKQHFVLASGRCSPMIYKLRDNIEGHPSCQENLAEAIKAYGLGPHDVPDVFNMFMNAGISEDGKIWIKPPTAKKGDYMELRAEIDILCAISACPDDTSVCNNHKPKPVGVKIFKSAGA